MMASTPSDHGLSTILTAGEQYRIVNPHRRRSLRFGGEPWMIMSAWREHCPAARLSETGVPILSAPAV